MWKKIPFPSNKTHCVGRSELIFLCDRHLVIMYLVIIKKLYKICKIIAHCMKLLQQKIKYSSYSTWRKHFISIPSVLIIHYAKSFSIWSPSAWNLSSPSRWRNHHPLIRLALNDQWFSHRTYTLTKYMPTATTEG